MAVPFAKNLLFQPSEMSTPRQRFIADPFNPTTTTTTSEKKKKYTTTIFSSSEKKKSCIILEQPTDMAGRLKRRTIAKVKKQQIKTEGSEGEQPCCFVITSPFKSADKCSSTRNKKDNDVTRDSPI